MSKKIKISIIVTLMAIVSGISLFIMPAYPSKPANLTKPTNDELNIQLGLEKSYYSIGEKITFNSFIKNPSATVKTYKFNSTCTQGNIYINEQKTGRVHLCGQAITKADIDPYFTVTYKYPFTLVDDFSYDVSSNYNEYAGELKLSPGQHQAKLIWQGFESNTLTFHVE